MSILSRDDLRFLTGYRRRAEQERWLAGQGIPYREVDGRLVVAQAHFLAWAENRECKSNEPRLDLVS
jgi:hypothetical protein